MNPADAALGAAIRAMKSFIKARQTPASAGGAFFAF
jgi:hypothetical protein